MTYLLIFNTHLHITVHAQIRCRSLKKDNLKIGRKNVYSGVLKGGHIHTYTLHNRNIFSSG
jgi:hypothetical protein